MISLNSSNSKRLWLDVMELTLIAVILRLIQFDPRRIGGYLAVHYFKLFGD